MTPPPPSGGSARAPRLRELAAVFLKLGTIAFGGPAAHVAMMEEEVVVRRKWLSREAFLDYYGATNLIPGPNSTELAIHIGHTRAGWPGLLVAGACFILPAALLVAAIAWLYVTYGRLPQVQGLLYGVKPVVIAIVVQALWRLGRSAVKSAGLALLGAAAIGASMAGVHELVVLALAAAVAGTSAVARQLRTGTRMPGLSVLAAYGGPGALGTAAAGMAATTAGASLGGLFTVFLKIGAVLFGSGYVLLAFLRADLVERLGWITERQLLDAVAVGQVTPGPVFTTATFVGYVVAGGPGAIVATVGIFLPAFVFVALSGPLVPKLRRSPIAGAVLDGVNVGSLALMAVVSWALGRAAVVDGMTVVLTLASFALLVRWKVNSAWLVLGGALVGLAWRG
jgi:chromate transporter